MDNDRMNRYLAIFHFAGGTMERVFECRAITDAFIDARAWFAQEHADKKLTRVGVEIV